jgi:hypothetical protein
MNSELNQLRALIARDLEGAAISFWFWRSTAVVWQDLLQKAADL